MKTADFLQGELERLFELETMMSMSSELLGIDPADLGGTAGKGTYARALVTHCATHAGLGALADAIQLSARTSGPRSEPPSKGEDKELAPATQAGGFRILKRLAQGPLAIIYLAERVAPSNGHTERAVLKVFHSDKTGDKAAAWRLLTRARALKNVGDSGLANIYEAGTLPDGRVFVATEYISGQTLAARVGRTGAIHFNELRSVVRTLLKGVHTLHARGLLHGHIKAENVFLVRPPTVEGEERPQPYGVLSDLGTARLLEGDTTTLPGVLRLVGDPSTMAPEVARGQAPDARSEVYAMGCVIYQALTGSAPFSGDTAIETIAAHLYEVPKSLSERAPRNWVPPELSAAVIRALSKDPAARYESARDFADALEGVALSIFPAATAPALDLQQLQTAIAYFREQPSDGARAAQLEALVAPSKDWQQVIDTFLEAAAGEQGEAKKQLLFRSARILADEMKDLEAAERVYGVVLEYDATDAQAHNAIEELHRSAGDHEGLVGLLLDRLENESDPETRAAMLREAASLYEEHLDQSDNALVAYVQALAEDPHDERSARALERLAKTPAQWNEAISTLNGAIESTDRQRNALRLCVLVGGFYVKRIQRPDYALTYLNRALQIDPAHEPALEAITNLYRDAQAWQELVQILLHRADAAATPSRARELRAEAATVVHGKLRDVATAQQMFAQIFADDPAHPSAIKALEAIYSGEQNWTALSELLENKVKEQRGAPRVESLCKLAELYEDRITDHRRAAENYEAALAIDEKNLIALKGLERIYARLGNQPQLLENLEQQLTLATTPAQRIGLLERIANLVEQLSDTAKAAERFEQLIELAPGHDAANTALARLYRALHRFDDLAQTLDRHAKSVDDNARKVELLLQAARVLMADVGSPERAQFICERILGIQPNHPEALSLTTRIRALAGDTMAAIDSLELLADTEKEPQKRAELWVRAGQMLEGHDDLDGAIDRYKLALDADPSCEASLEALSRLYGRRGDTRGEAELLLRKVELSQDPSTKAKRLVVLGTLRLEKLKDKALAGDAFERARVLDPTNIEALLGLGRLALERSRWEEATSFLEPLLDRTTELSAEVALQVCLGTGDAFRALDKLKEAERAYLNAKAVSPHDRGVLERLSDLAMKNGHADEAAVLIGDLLDSAGTALTAPARGELLLKLGTAQQKSGAFAEAAASFERASQVLGDDVEPLDRLMEVEEAQEKWEAVARTLRRRLGLAQSDDDRFGLLVKAGDIYAMRLQDREQAAKSYVAALEVRAEDRNLLSKLMAVYSENKDWSRLLEVLVRMAGVVEDPKLRGRYFNTAAAVSHGELGAFEQAIEHYERALAFDPSLDSAFRGMADCLQRTASWEKLARAYRQHIERVKGRVTEEELASLWDNLGETCHYRLNRLDEAVEAYEAAHVLDRENRARTERLVEIYAKHPSRYADRAITAHAELLAQNSYRVESYQALRKLYTQLSRPDEAWCVCQALRSLNMAEPDEEAFFKRHRVQAPATARECITEDVWQEYLVHPDQDALLTTIFATMQAAAISEHAQPPQSFGVARDGQVDCPNDPSVMAQMLFYASGVTLIPLPAVFRRPNDAGGLSFLYTAPPAIGLGQAAFQSAPDQALAFIAGRQLSYFRPGHYMRQLVPTGSGLRSWLLAAIRISNPRFPAPEAMRAQVDRNQAALTRTLSMPQQQSLTSLVERLMREQPELDMKRWALGVDLTADRVGFVLANSVDAAVAVVRASPPESSHAAERDRMKDIYLYAVSPPYLALRQALGITIA